MRLTVATAALVLAAAPAFAQPIPQPERPGACLVSIMRAPDDVREVIETWVRAEPRCTTILEVRVVPTEGGLYLFARSQDGRVRERIVPDAQSAGVLVASWAADDWVAPPPPPATEPTPTPAPTSAQPPSADVAPMAPGVTGLVQVLPRREARSSRWLSLGLTALATGNAGAGFRGEADLISRGRWTFGVGLGLSQQAVTAGSAGYGTVTVWDVRALVNAGRTWGSGPWTVRAAFGLGLLHTQVTAPTYQDPTHTWPDVIMTGSETIPMVEASLLVSRELGDRWAITAGPQLTVMDQKLNDNSVNFSRRAEIVIFGALRHRL